MRDWSNGTNWWYGYDGWQYTGDNDSSYVEPVIDPFEGVAVPPIDSYTKEEMAVRFLSIDALQKAFDAYVIGFVVSKAFVSILVGCYLFYVEYSITTGTTIPVPTFKLGTVVSWHLSI